MEPKTGPAPGLLAQLSSAVGDRTQAANQYVAGLCLDEPGRLEEILPGLQACDPALAGDAAEVCTLVAAQRPELVAPHAGAIAALIEHKNTRVRWEAAHALACCAVLAPETIESLLPVYEEILDGDKSVIVRDYSVDALGSYAGTSRAAALLAYPLLLKALAGWEGKQAGHSLNGLAQAARVAPELRDEIRAVALRYLDHPKAVIKRAARAVLISCGEDL